MRFCDFFISYKMKLKEIKRTIPFKELPLYRKIAVIATFLILAAIAVLIFAISFNLKAFVTALVFALVVSIVLLIILICLDSSNANRERMLKEHYKPYSKERIRMLLDVLREYKIDVNDDNILGYLIDEATKAQNQSDLFLPFKKPATTLATVITSIVVCILEVLGDSLSENGLITIAAQIILIYVTVYVLAEALDMIAHEFLYREYNRYEELIYDLRQIRLFRANLDLMGEDNQTKETVDEPNGHEENTVCKEEATLPKNLDKKNFKLAWFSYGKTKKSRIGMFVYKTFIAIVIVALISLIVLICILSGDMLANILIGLYTGVPVALLAISCRKKTDFSFCSDVWTSFITWCYAIPILCGTLLFVIGIKTGVKVKLVANISNTDLLLFLFGACLFVFGFVWFGEKIIHNKYAVDRLDIYCNIYILLFTLATFIPLEKRQIPVVVVLLILYSALNIVISSRYRYKLAEEFEPAPGKCPAAEDPE